jgi:hypothetical protein
LINLYTGSVSPRGFLTAGVLTLSLAALSGRDAVASYPETSAPTASGAAVMSGALSTAAWPSAAIGTLQRNLFEMALGAAACAVRSGDIADLATLTVIDYSRPSTDKRLWVFDLKARALLYEELVAHGKGSGDNMATAFSNDAESRQSSLGLFRTDDAYMGKNGYSLRLRGLDTGFNDHAFDRAIVMHGASYVSDEFARTQGRLGRSWGCPALREGIAHEVIDAVKGNGLVFAYYPDPAWLSASKYLRECDAVPTPHAAGL